MTASPQSPDELGPPSTTFAGLDFTPNAAAELNHVIEATTQSIGTLAALIATRNGGEQVSFAHVKSAAEKFRVIDPPKKRQVAEAITVFLLGAVISTLIQFIAGDQDVPKWGWIGLGLAALILAPTATALWIINRRT